MLGLGIQELMVVGIIVLVLFGGSKLPELGKGMGEFIKNFKKATSGHDEIDVTPKQEAKSTTDEGKSS